MVYVLQLHGDPPKLVGTFLGGPFNKDYSLVRSILGSPYLGNLPRVLTSSGPCRCHSGTPHPAELAKLLKSLRKTPRLRLMRIAYACFVDYGYQCVNAASE